ncbi:hypothetical protein AKJ09_07930 [Labilithrix luteola]|uniref:Lipoprotein n=1 Tax=Labilithrix luteola TaxID=1391654 RepID=A0A0K1Q6J8_9BACT|nr:hypothetical protein [Labilithrix luteola]AKV01267.1 hypothetical protein AKJ09_07930 [Labilithrix luteola]
MNRFHVGFGAAFVLLLTAGCDKPKHYTTTVQLAQLQRFGQTTPGSKASIMDLELKFVDCPGDAMKLVRADKAFGECAANFKSGDKLEAELVSTYSSERGGYRNEVVRIGSCPLKMDPKEEANYEMVQTCRDLEATGVVVGVHCDRQRSKELVAKCPWFRR